MQPQLHKYQQRAVRFLERIPKAALFIDMGLGKTLITLTHIQDCLDLGVIRKVLVIAPLRVTKTTWPDEIKKWGFRLNYSVVTGGAKDRERALARKADVYLINRENVIWLIEHCAKLRRFDFDALVIDESSSFKNSDTRRFKQLARVLHQFKKVILLTGTPAPNSLQDLWAQMKILDGGERLGRTLTAFRQSYCTQDYSGFNWLVLESKKEVINDRISDICLSMRAEDYIDLPGRVDNKLVVELSDKEMKLYSKFKENCIASLGGEELTAFNAAALANKLMQLSNGFAYVGEEKSVVPFHDKKLEALQEILESNEGKPVLVAYNFIADMERIKEKIKGVELLDKNPETIRRWNDKKIPVLLAHPASAGHGLNLQYGGSIIVWYGLTWSLELYQQFNARLLRQGQKETTIIHHIMTKDTVDYRVWGVLQGKDKTQNALLNALKQEIEK